MALTSQTRTNEAIDTPPRGRGRSIALTTAAVVAGTAASLLRQPGPGALNTIWAEDGEIFLTQAVRDGAGAFTTSYAGYYHLVARIVAAVAAVLPAAWAGAVLAAGAALITTVFAVAVYHLSGEYLSSNPPPTGRRLRRLTSTLPRLVVSVPVAVLPMAQGDVLNSPANLHWTGLYLLFWLLVSRPATTAGRVLACAGIVLVTASDILTGVYVPLAAFVVWFHRDRYAWIKAAAFGVPFAVQVLGLLTGQSEREGLTPDPVLGVTGYVFRAVPAAFFGERWVGTKVSTVSLVFTALAVLLVVAVLLLAWLRRTTARWWFALAAALHSAALYIAPVGLSGIATPRYNVAPALLLLVAVVSLVLPKYDARVLTALSVLIAIVCVVNFRVVNPRSEGPAWDDGIDSGRVACVQSPGGTVSIELPPLAAPGWHATLPCDYVDRN
ncbi:hypothetical protein Drose_07325 [Dactylosporangium roseum]|uniref:Integral membrane protein-like protein n=1 Tax=Dactylosporangium roseum TaxID=47989 RepID=A0ABY5Z7L8_9ACTN|nr:hypothetical protein [Dactylosporangium roseum]UWZ38065.1 hypothetical protein Drose_07325 [Dactylosporangium roseum]